ncbi:MAG: DNA (cytosine-5-)-methyltransferase [Bacteroidaceae bacterium]|nr:DNA (cytosine-5-)-methyltransferase [Bacteroidaceae bacterium]
MKEKEFTFIDLFAGIGGFHQAMHSVGGTCVFASEWDKYARISYEANYNEIEPKLFEKDEEGRYKYFNEDINDANPQNIPDFDVCCGGFPCQAFSIAGLKRGFEDTRGTLFFNIANIVKYKKEHGHAPKVLFMENVKGLKLHDKGNTLRVILATLGELNYGYKVEVLNAKYFGVPQNRERLFIIAWDKEQLPNGEFNFPYGIDREGNSIYSKEDAKENCIETHIKDIFEPREALDNPEDRNSIVTISNRMWIGHQERKKRNKANGKGFGYSLFTPDATYCSTISARYWKDGSEILIDQSEFGLNPRKLTPTEAGRLQGYNIHGNGWENFESNLTTHEQIPFRIVVSKKEAYHQFGNSVAVPVIKRIAMEIVKQLLNA